MGVPNCFLVIDDVEVFSLLTLLTVNWNNFAATC
uniref:Uncharacterized protein n=1 Tax=Rhizophora mucronata TaxID=61149 RepID=A0A2P2NL53_RHIMU